MDNYTSIEDFTLAISHITQDEDGCYTWELLASPIGDAHGGRLYRPGKFRTDSEGRGVWRWSEYLCDWVQVMETCHFSLVCAPSVQRQRVTALHTVLIIL